ncbi:LysE family transporter [Kutzneria sp. NPDC051319]|uniref:LysE family transporter n=1 Tax=Kutzneria sp. NPDC051319 TaxID=3155047 RepID=UPI003422A309
MSGALVAGLVAGFGIAIPVGAVGTYLMALTARTSLRTGAAAALGVATADGLYALISTLGGAVLVPVIQPITEPLRWVSAAVLTALALRGAVKAVRDHGRPQEAGTGELTGPGRAYVALLGITLVNPMTLIYFTALVLGGPTATDGPVFVLAAFAASASWQLLLAGGGALLGRALSGPRGRLATALVSSAVIVGLAVGLLKG